MLFATLLVAAAAVAATAVRGGIVVPPTTAGGEPMRLIEFAPANRTWLAASVVEAMTRDVAHHRFLDVTDYPEVRADVGARSEAPLPPSADMAQLRAHIAAMRADDDADQLFETINHLSEAFATRYYRTETAKNAVLYMANQYQEALNGSPLQGEVQVFEHERWVQPSLITTVKCALPAAQCAKEVVVLGAHIDSTTFSNPSASAPGADDDASGSAVVLQAFRMLLRNDGWKPNRDIQFQHYAAEEAGLLGSQEIVAKMKEANIEVLAMVQHDMTGFKNGPPGIIRDFTNDELSTEIKKIAVDAIDFPLTDSSCGYGCSDHASFHRAGYRAAFPFETEFSRSNGAIHTTRDRIGLLDKEHCMKFGELAAATAFWLTSEL